jgi:hypothetical protein
MRPTRMGAIQVMAARPRRTREGDLRALDLDHNGLAGHEVAGTSSGSTPATS